MAKHLVLVGFNEAQTDARHEAGEVVDLSHISDLRDLIANGTAMAFVEIDPPAEVPADALIVEPKSRGKS